MLPERKSRSITHDRFPRREREASDDPKLHRNADQRERSQQRCNARDPKTYRGRCKGKIRRCHYDARQKMKEKGRGEADVAMHTTGNGHAAGNVNSSV